MAKQRQVKAAMPPGRLGGRLEKRIERKGLRSRQAAYAIGASWAVGVVVFGVIECLVDPRTFDNVWIAMWWAMQTVTTVGYGDVVPGGTAEKLIGSFLMLGGLSLYAVITGVVTSGFVMRAQADREARREGPTMAKLAQMDRRLEAIEAGLGRRRRGSG